MRNIKKFEKPKIYFTGVGGQGTLTATKLLAHAALDAGINATAGEVHGMAQRGGVVESFLLLGGWRSPRLDYGEADILLGFEPLETLRGLPYLHKEGIIFSALDPLPPLSVSLGENTYPDLEYIRQKSEETGSESIFIPCRQLGEKAGAVLSGNTVLLAALCASGAVPLTPDDLANAARHHLPQKICDVNLRAIDLGVDYMQTLNK